MRAFARIYPIVAGSTLLAATVGLAWPKAEALFRLPFERPPAMQWRSLRLSEDARLAKTLGPWYPAYQAIGARTPADAVVSIWTPLDPPRFAAVRMLTLLLYPRRVDWHEPLTKHFEAHPEELGEHVFVLSLAPDVPLPLRELFDPVERAAAWELWRWRGVPR